MADSFLVIGAGQIGTPLAARLAALGHAVKMGSRKRPALVPAGVTHVTLDAADGAAVALAAAGARAVILAINPPLYDADAWARSLPPALAGAIEGAGNAGARLVVLENLYLYTLNDGPLSPSTRQVPGSKKGAVRKQLADTLVAAHAAGKVKAVSLRPSDFWGPDLTGAIIAKDVIDKIRAGKRPDAIGDVNAPHAFSHRDDVITALINLATASDDVLGQTWHAPVLHVSQAELLGAIAKAFGRDVKPRSAPKLLFVIGAWFSPLFKGLLEMLPQWEQPYRVDDSAYCKRFGVKAVTLEDGVRQLVSSAR
jgi:nucleoside-diphosphate-sugar epimerase